MGIIEALKRLAALTKAINNIEVQQQVIELQVQIMDMLEENRRLKEDLAELRASERQRKNLTVEDMTYWTNEDGKTDGPFCTRCYDVDGKLVRMRKHDSVAGSGMTCPQCRRDVYPAR
jgi:hypothetical protein